MTTGSVLLEPDSVPYSYTYLDPYGGSHEVSYDMPTGPYHSKTWSGGDSPRSKNVIPRLTRFVPPVIPPKSSRPLRIPRKWQTTWSDDLYIEYLANRRGRKAAFEERDRLLLERQIFVDQYKRDVAEMQRLRKREKYTVYRPPNGYTMDKLDGQFGVYRWTNDPTDGTFWVGNVWPTVRDHLPWDPAEEYKLINKLRDKVYGSGFHPGITAVEMPKALSMIGNASRKLRLGLIAASSGNWRGIVRNLGQPTEALYGKARWSWLSYNEGRMSLSQFWLELQYGWKPLLMDIEQAAGYIAFALNEPSAVSRRLQAKRTAYDSKDGLCPYGHVQMDHMFTITRVKYTITHLQMDSRFNPSLASLAGAAWERLPYSFVVDWVAPISAYLEALRFASGLRGVVVRSQHQESYWTTPKANGAKFMFQLSPLPTECKRVSFNRAVSTEIFVPPPAGDLSPSSIFKRWERAANAVALLQNLKLSEWKRIKT